MTESRDRRIDELIDRQDILDTLLRYTRGLDRLDLDLYRSAFHDDGLDCHGPAISPDGFLEWWLPKQDSREVTEHLVSNHTIDIDGDVAHVESYHLVAVKQHGEDRVNLHAGRYADRLERRDGVWRISLRVVIPSWHGIVPTEVGSAVISRSNWGRRSQEDPTYERPLATR
jgi:hypothetical protein